MNDTVAAPGRQQIDDARCLLSVAIESKTYAGTAAQVLADLSFDAHRGEAVALIGPSGAGKSTLLAMIAELDNDYHGTIVRNVPGVATGTGFTNISFVFQEPRLVPWLTVKANVELVLDQPNPDRVDELIANVGLGDFQDYYPNQLSGGMQRRLALIRAFIVDPKILLLDEPFVSLDAPTADQLRDQLMRLWDATKPLILFVTHNLDEAIAVADRILFMSKAPGRLIEEVRVDLPRPRKAGDSAVAIFREQLLSRQPDLLAGRRR